MTLYQMLCRKLNFRVHSARAGDENFNNMFYWSILYKKVYLSLLEVKNKFQVH